MSINRYNIHHFQLDQCSEPWLELTLDNHYVVFWYKSIPLGDRYIHLKEKLTEQSFSSLCLDAIWPVLESRYLSEHFRNDLIKPQTPTLRIILEACESILGKAHPSSIPQTCDLSVVICTRDRADQLRNCLELLASQICQPREIVVVDNASSTDDTRKVCESFNDVKYIREDRPGLDVARNTGARAAKSAIVAYTDDDTIPDPHWVFRVFETFQDPSIAAMTGLVIAASLQTEAEIIFEKHWPFNRGYVTKYYDNHFFRNTLETGPPVWEIGAGANMAFRKEIFEQVGYFDERLDVGAAGCSGDSEMWYRVLADGNTIVYNPLAVVQHNHRSTVHALKKQLYGYMRGFTVAILIQYQRFGHIGNLKHLIKVFPFYYMKLLRQGFPKYGNQYRTLLSEISGILSGFLYYFKHRNSDARIF